MRFNTVAIVGVGLMGGSIGRAVKAHGALRHVLGVGRFQEFLDLAVQLGAIDAGSTRLSSVSEADLIIVCTPVDGIAAIVNEVAAFAKPGAILTDIGSTKQNIYRGLHRPYKNEIEFVGSHPLAGSEKAGVEHARADLFDRKMVVVVPDDASETAVASVESFWQSLGARTARMTAAEHDTAVASTSHLPHALAAALARMLPVEWLPLAASGFKDTTRIAAGSPQLWEAILSANRDAVLAAAARYRQSMGEFEELLNAGDTAGLLRWLDEGKQVRDALGD